MSRKQKLLNSIKNIKNIDNQKIGRKLGEGAEGIVFEYGKNKIIKITDYSFETHDNDLNLFKYLKRCCCNFTTAIFDFGSINNSPYKDYWYIAERLTPLTKWERRVFDQVFNVYKYKSYKTIIKGNALKKALNLRSSLNSQIKLYFNDTHAWNVGKDKRGNWKVLDLCSLKMIKI